MSNINYTHLVTLIKSFNNYTNDISKFKEEINHMVKLLLLNQNEIQHFFTYNNFTNEDTAGVCILLANKLYKDHLLALKYNILMNGDSEQIALVRDAVTILCGEFESAYLMSDVNDLNMKSLAVFERVVDAFHKHIPHEINVVDTWFLQACLKTKHYRSALPYLNHSLYRVAKKSNFMTCKLLYLYFYYGGCIYIGLKQYRKSCNCFQTLLSIPSKSYSYIQLQAFKKYIIVSLIEYGKIPKQSSQNAISRNISNKLTTLAKGYEELEKNFRNESVVEFRNYIMQNSVHFVSDENLGLVKQLFDAQIRWKIFTLTNSYSILSLGEIATRIGLNSEEETLHVLIEMISKGIISAKINMKDHIVSFSDDSHQLLPKNLMNTLEEQMKEAVYLNTELSKVNREFSLQFSYIAETNTFINQSDYVTQMPQPGEMFSKLH